MAAGTWTIYRSAKARMGSQGGTLPLDTGGFKMALYTTAASASITNLSAFSLYSQIGTSNQVATSGGYVAGGKLLGNVAWTASGANFKFRYTTSGVIWTGTMTNIRYALIYQSASVTGGPVVCYAALSTAQFTVDTGNTLTVKPAAAGVFVLS